MPTLQWGTAPWANQVRNEVVSAACNTANTDMILAAEGGRVRP